MARRFVHSFILTAVLSSLVNAGPCRPSSSSAAVGTTTEQSTLIGSTVSSETAITASESAATTSSSDDATTTEQSTLTGSDLSTDTVITVSETASSISTSDDATATEQSTSTESAPSSDTTTGAGETTTATSSFEVSTATEQSTLTGSDLSTETTMTVSESGTATALTTETTNTGTCTVGEHPVFTETEEFMMASMFEDPTTTAAAEATATAVEAFECVDNLKEPSPTGTYCGAEGNVQSFSDNFKDLGQGSTVSLLECYKSCMQKSNCVTFLFEENNYCQLYKATITSFEESETSYKWYETKCFCDTDIEAAPTCEDVNPIINGGWDNGRFTPWEYYPRASGRKVVDFKIKDGGADDSAYRLQTGNFHYDKSMWLYQDIKACPGARFTCTFKWWWDKYYAIDQGEDDNGEHFYLVPYVRIYQDNDDYALTSEFPRSDADTMKWKQGSFRFTVPSDGETRIWYIASSPQGEWINTSDDPCNPEWVHRPNALALDSMICYPN
ncbi:hypothetical protein ACHAPU_000832 [Fusarium lateritium]